MQQLEIKSNNSNTDTCRAIRTETLDKDSDDNEFITVEEAFEDLESESLSFKEALEFMEIPEKKFIEFLKIEKPFSKNFQKQAFPALFLIDLKLKYQD